MADPHPGPDTPRPPMPKGCPKSIFMNGKQLRCLLPEGHLWPSHKAATGDIIEFA